LQYYNVYIKTAYCNSKEHLEYHDVDISPRKFKLKVKLPKAVIKRKEALSKEDIIDILNICDNIRLRTYVMLLAATGMRAVEALSIRIKDLDFDSNPAMVFVIGEYTKTKVDRTVFLTDEVVQQLKSWLDYKYRTHNRCIHIYNHTKSYLILVATRLPRLLAIPANLIEVFNCNIF
jgi:integrase